MNIDNVHKIYEDMTYKEPINDKLCDCDVSEYVLDSSLYYLVCDNCGQCQDINKDYRINYSDLSSYKFIPKRFYKRSSYLKNKLKQLLHSYKPILPIDDIKILKKKVKHMNINNVNKYMKKKKLLKQYDPIKTFYYILNIQPPRIDESEMRRLINDFQIKEGVYKNNSYKRFNYNFILLKIFEEWGRGDLINCIKVLQDTTRIESHQKIYDELFN